MTAASKAPSIVDDGVVPQQPPASVERQNVKAMPAYASEGPNGAPSNGPNPEHGMTAVVDNTVERVDENETVHMVHADGHEVDVGVADVRTHERAGWKRV